MLVNDFLENSARLWPDKVALIFGDRRLTYAEIDAAANRLANCLIANGVKRGDRVGVFMDNSVELVLAIFGILKAGGAFSVINGGTKANKLTYILNNCRAAALISSHRKAAVLSEALPAVHSLQLTLVAGARAGVDYGTKVEPFDDALRSQPATAPRRTCIDVDLAAVIYTSGTTGAAKGVMATHLMAVTIATSINEYLEHMCDDVILNALPLSFGYGFYQLLTAFKAGATLVLEDGFAFPFKIVDAMRRESVTGIAGVPTMFAMLLQMKDLQTMEFPHLRYLTNAAAALPVNHLQRVRSLFPQAKFYSMYGQTECQRVCYLPPKELDLRPGSVGIAIPNTEVYIVDDQGNRAPQGTVGELVVRGSHIMLGYWEAPAETARALRPGPLPGERVLYTGDLFRMDEDGFLYFVSRKDDMIKSRGEKVSPKEVENAIYLLDGVVEAAVVGVPDPVLGEAIAAFVVTREDANLTERDVLAQCSRQLEDYMVPRRVEFWPSLPKTESGKISKALIRERLECAALSAR